ncbi:MAG: hypothetical protein C0621_10490 [Desulfuromonas sp.]|nr:MAG: hypothetical protein C0621_10490 [Desulfuromonas sp.]
MKLLFLRLMGSVLLLSLVACGGGGSSAPATVTGTLVDSFVAGVNYTCSSGMSGITNASGEFTCGANDTVEFFLGAYLLGTCSAQETVTPYDLFPADEAAAVNVARLLQTLDENGDPSDGITVPADFTQLDAVTVAPGGASFDTDVNTALGTTLVTALDAQNHMDGVIVTSLFAGKTLYTTIYDAMGTLEQWAFSADMTQAVWTELVGGSDSGSATLSVDGRVLTADDGTGTETITIAEINDDYIVITFSDGTSQRLYFNRAAAEAYFQVVVAEPLESIIGGQTFYTTIDDTMGTLESWAFNATATQGTWTELVGGSETGNVSVSINGMVMTFTEPEGTEVITVTEVTTDYLILTFSDSSTLRIYFDRATAETYFQVATTTTLQSIIGGQTFYTTIYDMMGTLESWTFNADATQGTWAELVGGSETGNVSV